MFCRADYCFFVRGLLELVPQVIEITPGVNGKKCRIVEKMLRFNTKKNRFFPKKAFMHTLHVNRKGYILSKYHLQKQNANILSEFPFRRTVEFQSFSVRVFVNSSINTYI